ncbi:MAG TPA: hypothetical protein VGK27_08240 [Candidatus Deferrimicrobiaceae bacterium]|jgi:hypothetical protein
MRTSPVGRLRLRIPIGALLFAALAACLPRVTAAQEPPEIVCIQCHSRQAGKIGEPVGLWRQSVHAENGIACNGCHGGDPKGADAESAMSPARGFLGAPKETDIPAFCGKCHVGVLKDYLASAHGQALGSGGPTCVTCHGNHKVLRASLDLINEKDCSRCHGFDRARIIRDAMVKTESRIVALDKRIQTYKDQGADVDRIEKGLFAIRNRFHTLFHDQDVDKVWEESVRIDAELGKLDGALKAMDETQHRRKTAGAVAIAGALLAAALLYLIRKSYD